MTGTEVLSTDAALLRSLFNLSPLVGLTEGSEFVFVDPVRPVEPQPLLVLAL